MDCIIESSVENKIQTSETPGSVSLSREIGVVCLYGEGRPRLDLEYPVCGAYELAEEGAFTSVVVLTASFPSWFCRGRDLNP